MQGCLKGEIVKFLFVFRTVLEHRVTSSQVLLSIQDRRQRLEIRSLRVITVTDKQILSRASTSFGRFLVFCMSCLASRYKTILHHVDFICNFAQLTSTMSKLFKRLQPKVDKVTGVALTESLQCVYIPPVQSVLFLTAVFLAADFGLRKARIIFVSLPSFSNTQKLSYLLNLNYFHEIRVSFLRFHQQPICLVQKIHVLLISYKHNVGKVISYPPSNCLHQEHQNERENFKESTTEVVFPPINQLAEARLLISFCRIKKVYRRISTLHGTCSLLTANQTK